MQRGTIYFYQIEFFVPVNCQGHLANTIGLENDCPIESASEMLGHNSIRTTQIYAKATYAKVSSNMKDVKRKIADRLKLLMTGS